jgi:hypothetical protein
VQSEVSNYVTLNRSDMNHNSYDAQTGHKLQCLQDNQLNARLQAKYQEKPLHIRLKGVKILTEIYSYLGNTVSFATGFFIISYFLGKEIANHSSPTIAIVVGSIIGGLSMLFIEATKRGANDSLYINYFMYGKFSSLSFLAVLLSTVLSVGLSFVGGRMLPKVAEAPPKFEVDRISLDTHRQEFESNVAKLEAERDRFFEANKKPKRGGGWRLSSTLIGEYNQFNDRIAKLEANWSDFKNQVREHNQKAEERAVQGHEEALTAYQQKQQQNANIIGWIVLFFELGFLLSMWFLHWLDFKTAVLMGVVEPQNNNPDNNPNDPNGNQQTVTNGKNSVITNTNQTNSTNQPHQRQQPYILIDDYKDPVFTMQRIRNFVNAYQSKIRNWKTQKAKGKDPNEKSLNGYLSNLEKWRNYEQELQNKISQTQQS